MSWNGDEETPAAVQNGPSTWESHRDLTAHPSIAQLGTIGVMKNVFLDATTVGYPQRISQV